MAESTEAATKATLIATLHRSRIDFSQNLHAVQRDADFGSHFKKAFARHKAGFISGAAGLGWILAWLPTRKKKVYVSRRDEKKIKEAGEASLLVVALKLLFSMLKPALATFASKQVSVFMEKQQGKKGSRPPKW